jgi:hypothetical protein
LRARSALIQPTAAGRPLQLASTWLKSGTVTATPTASPSFSANIIQCSSRIGLSVLAAWLEL